MPCFVGLVFFFQAEDGIRDRSPSRGLGDVYKRQYMDLARFDDATKHMIIFDVLTDESPVGWKGERNRLYLSDVGYQKALDNQKAGNIKIISHAAVAKGNLYYDHRDMAR